MITVALIRDYIMDRTPADNPLSGDLEFSDDEIRSAMGSAARAFNSLPPRCVFVNPENLPSDSNVMFAATACFLYQRLRHRLCRNDFEYQGGNVSVNMDRPKIEHLNRLIKEEEELWKSEASALKRERNTRGFYASFE